MHWTMRIAVGLVLSAIGAANARGEEPAARPMVKVEFRWVAAKHIPGVTDEKAHFGEGDEPYYLHRNAILTNRDIVGTRVTRTAFGGLGDKFLIHFEITDEAKRRLAADHGERGKGSLAAVVDGRIFGSSHFQTADMAKFEPFAGFFDTRAEVDRVVAALKK